MASPHVPTVMAELAESPANLRFAAMPSKDKAQPCVEVSLFRSKLGGAPRKRSRETMRFEDWSGSGFVAIASVHVNGAGLRLVVKFVIPICVYVVLLSVHAGR